MDSVGPLCHFSNRSQQTKRQINWWNGESKYRCQFVIIVVNNSAVQSSNTSQKQAIDTIWSQSCSTPARGHFSTRIRRVRGGTVVFSLCVSSRRGGGGKRPTFELTGGVPTFQLIGGGGVTYLSADAGGYLPPARVGTPLLPPFATRI